MYTLEEVTKKALEYFSGDGLATDVWINKYALKNREGEFLEDSPKAMHIRMAKEFHRIESKYKNALAFNDILELLDGFDYFIPAGSCMFGIGNNYSISSLGNCFVAGNSSDSYGGIMDTDQSLVQLMKRRGGVGHDLSHLRYAGAPTTNSAKSSTGVVPFAERYSNTTREVAQDGRRGALMLTLDVAHPDIREFITAKTDISKLTGANISAMFTDEFMTAVQNNDTFMLRFPVDIPANPKMGMKLNTIYNFSDGIRIKVKAIEIWNLFIEQAKNTAEPGALFIDTIREESPADCYEAEGLRTVSTNPCGEQPLSIGDSCRLGAMNLFSYVVKPFTKDAYFDMVFFKSHIRMATRLMDDVVELELEKVNTIINKIKKDPEPAEIKAKELALWQLVKEAATKGRRAGLGYTGLADCLAALGLTYGTKEATDMVVSITKEMAISSYKTSIVLAEERGAFPIWDFSKEKDNPFIARVIGDMSLDWHARYGKAGRRNVQTLTVAPTGSLSILAQVSSGLEPVFKLNYMRRRKVDKDHPNAKFKGAAGDWFEEYNVLHPKFKAYIDTLYIEASDVEASLETIIKESPYAKATAEEIFPLEKVRMQGLVNKYIDSSISITHNLPKGTTSKEVSDIYMTAWKSKCKGCTIYVDGSRDGVLVSTKDTEDANRKAPKRPKNLPCEIYTPSIRGTQYAVVVGLYESRPYEVFATENKWNLPRAKKFVGTINRVKKGTYNVDIEDYYSIDNISKDMNPDEEDKTRLISANLRHGMGIEYLVEQLNASKGSMVDFSKVIARILKRFIKDGTTTKEVCPECGNSLRYISGCKECTCGYSKCS